MPFFSFLFFAFRHLRRRVFPNVLLQQGGVVVAVVVVVVVDDVVVVDVVLVCELLESGLREKRLAGLLSGMPQCKIAPRKIEHFLFVEMFDERNTELAKYTIYIYLVF